MPYSPGDEITTPTRTYTITGPPTRTTGLYTLYPGSTDVGPVQLKVSLDTDAAGDWVSAEALNLARVFSECDDRLKPFLPHMVAAFPHDDSWVNVFEPFTGWYSLTEVHARYPNGVDPKDLAWMFRRSLAVLGFLARIGVEHRAFGMDAMLILPPDHGLKLIDWSLVCFNDEDYEPDVDLTLIVESFITVAGGNPKTVTFPASIPREIASFLTTCHRGGLKTEPWELLRAFDELLERIWGKRRFHEFSMT